MNTPRTDLRARTVIVSIAMNFLLSSTILPFFIPPFRTYALHEFIEVLLWQGMGMIGWPMAILGGFFSLLFNGSLSGLENLLLLLIYPGMLFLLIRVLRSGEAKRWEIFLLHLLLTFSFGAVWYRVLNGYIFMSGSLSFFTLTSINSAIARCTS